MMQEAFIALRERGDEAAVARLANLIADHSYSTRSAAKIARSDLDVIVTHNSITAHRNDNCRACQRAKERVNRAADNGKKKARRTKERIGRSALGDHVTIAASEIDVDVSSVPPGYKTPPVGNQKSSMHYDDDGGVTIKDVPLNTPLLIDDDLSPLLTHFGLNPSRYEVLNDTFSVWMQSARANNGDRDVTYLYSAKFRKVDQADPDISNRDLLDKWKSTMIKASKPLKPTYKASAGKPGTYAILPSDPQFGKPGTKYAYENFRHGVLSGLEKAQSLMDAGVPVEGLHLGFGGDETEGVANNYGNQSHIIELNQAEQLELDFDTRMWAIKECLQLGLPLSKSSVISNHGEWTRNGGKDPVTSKRDNSSTFVARLVRKTFENNPKFRHVDFTIGGAEDPFPGVILNLSGVKVYMTHAHIEKGKVRKGGPGTEQKVKGAMEAQILGDLHAGRHLQDVKLFLTAHYHHHWVLEDRGYTVIGLPALEHGSDEYMKQQFGVWSPSGMLGMLIGDFNERKYSDLTVFTRSYETEDLRNDAQRLLAP